ncbi:MAG TPA: hypothetical protein VGJ22_01980, partial [Anaerolineales bacterium]
GRDEDSALTALLDYGSRYARVLRPANLPFHAPQDVSAFKVVERLKGNATTDFGAPDASPSDDKQPLKDAEFGRLQAVLKSCWQAFDEAVRAAKGKELRKGPRGGGRELDGIVEHVIGSELAYLASLGWKVSVDDNAGRDLKQIRQESLEAARASAAGEIPKRGPRGGVRWTARYFVRRVAWHVLDHAWELEDRVR